MPRAPPKFAGGVLPVHDGMSVPYDPQLRPSPGYVVAPYFWAYINRGDLFPGGWLHDVGLPMSDTFTAVTIKQASSARSLCKRSSGEDGQGLLIGTLNWMNEGPAPQPPTQPPHSNC